jgi:hypothetical protein
MKVYGGVTSALAGMSGQLQNPAALSPVKESSVPIV